MSDFETTTTSFASKSCGTMHVDRIPQFSFDLRKFSLPGMTMGDSVAQTPFGAVRAPGERIDYEEVEVEFFVSGDWRGYREVVKWLRSIRAGAGRLSVDDDKSDVLVLLKDSLRGPSHQVRLVDAFPKAVKGIDFDAATTDDSGPLTASVTLAFSDVAFEDEHGEEW